MLNLFKMVKSNFGNGKHEIDNINDGLLLEQLG